MISRGSAPGDTVTARLRTEVTAQRRQFDPAQQAAAQHLDALRERLLSRKAPALKRLLPWLPGPASAAPRGIYLWGGVGRGKTLLMDLFFASLGSAPPRSETLRAAASRPPALRSHFYHFMRGVHAELGAIKQHAEPLKIVAQRLAARSVVICLDEFFVADIADAMILAGLLDALFRRGVTLVTTSNQAPQDLYKDGLQRQRFLPAIAAILAHLDVLHLDGAVDYRLRRLEQAPTYLDSHCAGVASEMQHIFAALTGGAGAGLTALRIEGRVMHAVNSDHGTVWFEFAELCQGPRSQNDYIELAHLYHTMLLANVPVLDADENAARRFIMLIDELYDRGVKLVLSAAAAPAALYRGERLRFEFARTASRLIEMQTQHYLSGQHRS